MQDRVMTSVATLVIRSALHVSKKEHIRDSLHADSRSALSLDIGVCLFRFSHEPAYESRI